jgi:hypothetical protein
VVRRGKTRVLSAEQAPYLGALATVEELFDRRALVTPIAHLRFSPRSPLGRRACFEVSQRVAQIVLGRRLISGNRSAVSADFVGTSCLQTAWYRCDFEIRIQNGNFRVIC